jgi:hypothetical protein
MYNDAFSDNNAANDSSTIQLSRPHRARLYHIARRLSIAAKLSRISEINVRVGQRRHVVRILPHFYSLRSQNCMFGAPSLAFLLVFLCVFSLSPTASHGIPDVRPLIAGDIVSIDISCYVDGVHGDCCGTFIVEPVGAGSHANGSASSSHSSGGGGGGVSVTTVPRETRQLVEFARAVTADAVALCAPGVPLQHIGAFIQVRNV